MIQTYEGFLDVFKKKKSINDIYNALENKIESKSINIGIKRDPKVLKYRNTIYVIYGNDWGEEKSDLNKKLIQDIFFIRLKEIKKKLNCEIEINRSHNFKNILSSERELISKESEEFEINATEKIDTIVNNILSKINTLYFKFKIDSQESTAYIIELLKIHIKENSEKSELQSDKRKEFYKKVEDWTDSKFKELGMNNVEDIIDSYLRDDFEDIKFNNYLYTDGGLYIHITGTQREPDKSRIEHLKKKIICNEFIERFLSEYGEECDVKTRFEGEVFHIEIKVAELPDELKDKYGKY
jgi:hypothetical protein